VKYYLKLKDIGQKQTGFQRDMNFFENPEEFLNRNF